MSMLRTALTASARPAFASSSRSFHASEISRKTATEKVAEVAEKVNRSVGKGLAGAIEKGEKATEATKHTLGTYFSYACYPVVDLCLVLGVGKKKAEETSAAAEVERAAKLLRDLSQGKKVVDVDTTEDTIVFAGITHDEFAKELSGRVVRNVQRYGKVFYLELEGDGRHPVMHFGMTGMLQIKGQLPIHYREGPKKTSMDWPPKFMKPGKFILHLKGEDDEEPQQVAFVDPRRLGRIRLCKTPLTEPPISSLGFDPIISMLDLEYFKKGVLKRSCPIKALLLDQSFSAGVGNWVADEILYHARVHPEERCNVLTEDQLEALHTQTAEVCRFAVSVNADDSKFPEDWLFQHRWGKGKKEKHTLKLPDGKPATIKWLTVGGRTSAYVAELQKLRRGVAATNEEAEEADESELTPLSDEEEEEKVEKVTRKLKRKAKTVDVDAVPTKATRRRTSRKQSS
ncbi:hypothetical protein GSI_07065 [Ganoderma sinense ZZ0214-1]|uniref:Formamidopyrimidine-DNA glycosylase catalytic domain-containing protein n=1 Tax=Ganoderma sinense ZZ0214-1 TaxID=1077348 RepID=A0A2G8SAV6_9APHY|nr:hypothetical protein GSI_07065 [Ganoderma sinense ZZ0214-1]